MKVGQIVTIAEGDHAGKKGRVMSFNEDKVVLCLDFDESAEYIPVLKSHISIDDEVKRIWMVFGDETRPKPAIGSRRPEEQPYLPKVKHMNKDTAVAEMDKLAKSNPNKQFYLLESVAELKYEMELTKKEIIYD